MLEKIDIDIDIDTCPLANCFHSLVIFFLFQELVSQIEAMEKEKVSAVKNAKLEKCHDKLKVLCIVYLF